MKLHPFLLLGLVLLWLIAPVQSHARPRLDYSDSSGWTFRANDGRHVVWGVDADTQGCQSGNIDLFRRQCEASVYINANYIAIPITWRMVERVQGQYNFSNLDQFLTIVRENKLRAGIIWIGIDYAAGDTAFVPDFIAQDAQTYTRITGPEFDNPNLQCPSCPATIKRESAAYAAMMRHLKTHDKEQTVLAVNIGGENDYIRAVSDWKSWQPKRDLRCSCAYCNAAYTQGENGVEFMTRQFGLYLKKLIEAGAREYDIPTYTPVCAHKWFPGWRYAENPVALKRIVNRGNHFVAPSIAQTSSEEVFVKEELDCFLPENIPGNKIFVDGIDTGWAANRSHLELAPWYALFWYGGMGAVYWDAPGYSIVKAEELRNRLRTFWGPLKGLHYYIASLKCAGPEKRFWWSYNAAYSKSVLGDFEISQDHAGNDYGVCFRPNPREVIITCSTLEGPTNIRIARKRGWEKFQFERGAFDGVTGAWNKTGCFVPEIKEGALSFQIKDDSGDFARAVYRIFY